MRFITLIAVICMMTPATLFAAKDTFLLQDMCVHCHLLSENSGHENSVIKWKKSVHFRPDSGCVECHGGNKFLKMKFEKGHIGLPTKAESIYICGKCHVQAKNDFTNRPKAKPGEFDCIVTCVNCHDYHFVTKATGDLINKTNCGGCHSFDRVIFLQKTVAETRTLINSIESTIEDYKRGNFPTQSAQRKLDEIKKEYSRAFHSQPVAKIEKTIIDNTIQSLIDLEAELEESSPRHWKIEGIVVMIFLVLVVVLIRRYQGTIISRD